MASVPPYTPDNSATAAVAALQTITEVRGILGAGNAETVQTRASNLVTEHDNLRAKVKNYEGEQQCISRVLGPRRGEESVLAQAERARTILDRWQDIARDNLPDCPQLRNALAVADLGSRHFELRGFVSGAIRDGVEWTSWARYWSGLPPQVAAWLSGDTLRKLTAQRIEALVAKVREQEIALEAAAKREAALSQVVAQASTDRAQAVEHVLNACHRESAAEIEDLKGDVESLSATLRRTEASRDDAVEVCAKVRTALKCPDGAKLSHHATAVTQDLAHFERDANMANRILSEVRAALKTPDSMNIVERAKAVMLSLEVTQAFCIGSGLEVTAPPSAREKCLLEEAKRFRNLIAERNTEIAALKQAAETCLPPHRTAMTEWSYRVYCHGEEYAMGFGYASKEALRDNLHVALGTVNTSALEEVVEKVNAAVEKARETIGAAKQPAGEPTGEALQKVLQRVMPFEYSLDYAYGCASPWTWRGAGAVSHIYADASSCVRAAWSNKIAAARDEEAAKHAAKGLTKVWSGFIFADGSFAECPDLEVTAGKISEHAVSLYAGYAPQEAYAGLNKAHRNQSACVRVMVKGELSPPFICTGFTCDQYHPNKARMTVNLRRT